MAILFLTDFDKMSEKENAVYRTLVQLFDERAAEYPHRNIQMGKNRRGAFIPRTFAELQREVRAVALALRRHGVRRGDNIGIISDNRPEWLAADLAILALGAADVPRGRDAMPYEVEHILSVTEAPIAFAENEEQAGKILDLRSSLPALKELILIDGEMEGAEGIAVTKYADLLSEGLEALDGAGGRDEIEGEIAQGEADDTATIIFTSGTTGLPKGVMLSHRNMLYQLGEIDKIIDFQPGWKWLSVLPVWHSFERIIQYVAIYEASVLAYSKPIGKIMLNDLLRINPELMCSVPRIWETVKAGVNQSLRQKKPFERRMFSFFLAASRKYRYFEDMVLGLRPRFRKKSGLPGKVIGFLPYLLFGLLYRIGDRLAFSQIKEKFGSAFIAGISGGGSMSKDVDEFFSAIGVKLLNGYGMTETAPVIGVAAYPHSIRGFIHPFDGTELRVVSTEDGRILPPGEKGELLVRGPQVMKGYYKDQERTDRIIDREGFLHTGDLAVLEARGDFAIVGRVKDTIVLSGGENIEPVPIEAALMESEYIETAVAVGQDEKFLGALIVLDKKNTERYLKENRIPYISRSDLSGMEEVRHLISSEVMRLVSRERGFKPFEQVSGFAILCDSFQPGRELSAKQEVKRSVIQEMYASQIESIYR